MILQSIAILPERVVELHLEGSAINGATPYSINTAGTRPPITQPDAIQWAGRRPMTYVQTKLKIKKGRWIDGELFEFDLW